MSEHNSEKATSPRPLTRAELDAYGKEFERLGAAFDSLSPALLQAPDNPLLVPELRSAMSRAGWVLTRLLHHGAVSAPSKRPPWLSWRTFRVYRPLFLGLRARPFNSSCFPNNTVLGLVQMMRAGPQVVDKLTTRKPGEDSGAMFIRRHIWVEGVVGWLGQRCIPRTRATAPTVTAVIATGVNHLRDECLVHIVHDWDQDDAKQRLLFVDLARDSAAVSRYLAAELERQLAAPGGPPADANLDLLTEIEDMRRQHKRQAVDDARDDIGKLFSLWQETTDLLFRTNLGDDARVEELAHLRSLASGLSAAAYNRQMARTAIQVLSGKLRTLMPREWFADRDARELLRTEVSAANAEIEDLHHAWRERRATEHDPEATPSGSTGDSKKQNPTEEHRRPPPPTLDLDDLKATDAQPSTIPNGPAVSSLSPLQHQAGIVNGGDWVQQKLTGAPGDARLSQQAEFLLHEHESPAKLLREIRDRLALPRADAVPRSPPQQPETNTNGTGNDHVDVLGHQERMRIRRLAILQALPQSGLKAIVAKLDEFGQGGPDYTTVSKDITAMRKAGAVHLARWERTAKGDAVLAMHPEPS